MTEESDEIFTIDCPCCKYGWSKYIAINTDWGYEDFLECQNCGIIFRPKKQLKRAGEGGLMKLGSLFSGGGLGDFGFMAAGMEIAWQVEIDEYCQKILALRYPESKKYYDIKTLKSEELEPVDIITGGFPCQDVSVAGKRGGIEGKRSGLWKEYLRIICEIRPRWVVVENVTGLLSNGMGVVLRDLASSGYDAEWDCFPSSAFGSPQQRDRVWILAYPKRSRLQGRVCKSISKSQKRQGWKEQLERLHGEERKLAIPTGKSGGMSDGITNRVGRLKMLGNGQDPNVTFYIGKMIMEIDNDIP